VRAVKRVKTRRSTKHVSAWQISTYYGDIRANQSTPPCMYCSDLVADQNRGCGGASSLESGDEKKHVRAWHISRESKYSIIRLQNSLRKVVHGFHAKC